MTRRGKGLQAYRDLYGALCELSSSLFDQAVAQCRDERQAAALASCQLVRALGQGSDGEEPSGLLRRLTDVRWSAEGRAVRRIHSPG